MPEWIKIAVIITSVVMLSYYTSPTRSSPHLRHRLLSRPTLDVDSMLAERFSESEIDMAAAHKLMADIGGCYMVPAGKLRLDDRFDRELFPEGWFTIDSELSTVNMLVEGYKRKRNASIDITKLYTVEDCISAFCKRP